MIGYSCLIYTLKNCKIQIQKRDLGHNFSIKHKIR
nr:MAG TPA: hypothetical protein [Caudoviricetes sp.]